MLLRCFVNVAILSRVIPEAKSAISAESPQGTLHGVPDAPAFGALGSWKRMILTALHRRHSFDELPNEST